MCSVEMAFAGLKVASAATSWQGDRQQAANQSYADYKTRRNADQAYLNDLTKIETERGRAAREKGREEFRAKMKARKDLAAAQNAGFGNSLRVAQDIGNIMTLPLVLREICLLLIINVQMRTQTSKEFITT